MTTHLTIALAFLSLSGTASVHAQDLMLDTRAGVPQVSDVAGRVQTWRYLTLDLDTPQWSLQARLASCAQPLSTEIGVQAPGRPEFTGCAGSARTGSSGAVAQQLKFTGSLPPLSAGGPQIDVSALARSLPRGDSASAFDLATQLELELTQPLGPLELSLGYAVPLEGARSADPWRTTFGAVQWRPAKGHVLELGVDLSSALDTGERDRQISFRYAFNGEGHARWRVYSTRYLDDSVDHWGAGLGVDWTF